jgi:PAS domain-containing protein
MPRKKQESGARKDKTRRDTRPAKTVRRRTTSLMERTLTERYITSLNPLKHQLLGAGCLSKKLKLITNGLVDIMGADFARIWITREADLCNKGCDHATVTRGVNVCKDRTRCLHLMASSGRYTHTDGKHRRVPLGSYKIGRIATGEEAKFITNDAMKDPRVHDHAWAKSLGLVAFAGCRLVSSDGSPIGVLAFFRKTPILPVEEEILEDFANTTSQVVLAGMVEERNLQFASIVASSNDSIISKTLDGVITSWNRGAERLYGYSEDEALGLSAAILIPPELQHELPRMLERVRRGEHIE